MACSACNKAKQLVKQVNNIATGYTNLVITVPAVEELARKRIEICNTCPLKTPLLKVGKTVFYKCNECGCPLEALIRAPREHCSAGKW